MSVDPGDQRSFPSREEPLWAELLDSTAAAAASAPKSWRDLPVQPAPRRSLMPILFCALASLVLVLVCVGAVVISQARSQQTNPSLARPLGEERAAITAALDGAWHVSNDVKYRDMRRFLNDLEMVHATNPATFAKLVDWPKHMERFYKSYRWQPVYYLNRRQLDEIERKQFTMPGEASDFKIAAIEERSADDWYVYTYAQKGALSNAAYLFHVRRQKKKWKLVDWAEIAELRWEAEYNGIASGLLSGDFAYTQQERLIDEIDESDRLSGSGNIQGAEASLRRAENHSGIPQLQDSNFYLIATRWNALNNHKESERVLKRIKLPDQYPWSIQLLADLQFRRGAHAESLAAIDRFERCAGFHRDLAIVKIHCHAALKQKDQAESSALALLRYSPSDEESLSLALEHVSPAKLSQLFELLPNAAESPQRLAQAARSLLYDDAVESHRQIRDYVAKKLPQSSHVLELDASLLHYQGELEQALAIYKKILESEQDQNKRESAHNQYLSLQLQLKSPHEVYQEATNPRVALERMTDGIGDDEALISLGQLEKILPLHRQKDPDDPKLPWYVAQIAQEKQDWHAAASELKKAIESPSREQEEDYWKDELRSQLLAVRYHLGEGLDVYREASDPAVTFQSLASIMEQNDDWDTLQQLLALHRTQSKDLWARYYEWRVREIEARKSHDHDQLATVLAGYQSLAEENLTSTTIYPWLLETRMDELGIRTENWQSYIKSVSEPERLFSRLATRFRREQNHVALEELVAFARQKIPNSNALRQFDLDQMWDRQDYAGIIAYCAAHPTDTPEDPYVGRSRQDQLLMSFLMQGDTVSAWKLASEPNPKVDQQWLVRLAEGKPEVVRNFLEAHRDDLYSPLSIAADAWRVPAIQKYLQSDEFQRMRADFPLPFSTPSIATCGIIFFPESVSWTEDLIRERLRGVGLAGFEVQKLAQPPLVTNTFSLRTNSDVRFFTYGNTPYITATDLQTYGQSLDPAFKAAIARHRHWIKLEPRREPREEADQTWMKLVSAFAIDSIALWETLPHGGIVQVVVTTDIAKQLEGHPEKLRTFALPTEGITWLPQSETSEEGMEETNWYSRCRAIVNGGKPGRVLVRFSSGHITEEHWLNVVAVNHQHWGNYSIDAQLQEASVLNPLFGKGDMVRLSEYGIRRWED